LFGNDSFVVNIVNITVFIAFLVKEEQNSEPDPEESSYQSSPQAVLETMSSSFSTDSDASGNEWQILNHNGI
jgi:hypothetical protein